MNDVYMSCPWNVGKPLKLAGTHSIPRTTPVNKPCHTSQLRIQYHQGGYLYE